MVSITVVLVLSLASHQRSRLSLLDTKDPPTPTFPEKSYDLREEPVTPDWKQ